MSGQFMNDDTNEPMTVSEARAKYSKPGEPLQCPLCGDFDWKAGASVDEGHIDFYFLECGTCGTELLEAEG